MSLAQKPKYFIIAETTINPGNLSDMLKEVGAPDWHTDTIGEAEVLSEVAGRLCYKSFAPGLNPNVTKVREGNSIYLGNVLKQKHGSVFEHASVTVVFTGATRILTHELVRHRAGMAYSQESQRFVRLDNFDIYIPDLTETFEEMYDTIYPEGSATMNKDEWVQSSQSELLSSADFINVFVEEEMKTLIEKFSLDDVPFALKKKVTSALRRMVPNGVTNNIMVTGNHRAWRHIFENRGSLHAEQEIREVMIPLADDFKLRYPNIYQDMQYVAGEGIIFENSKI